MLMTLSTRPVVTMTETDPGARDPLQVPAPQGLRAVERLDTALDRLGLRTPAARDRALAVLMVLVSSGMLWAFVRLLAEEDGIRLPPTATALLGVLVYTQSLALCVRRSRPVLCLAVMALTHLGTVALLPPHVTAQSLAPFIAAYTCGTLLPPRRLLRCITAVVVLLGLSGAAVAGTLPGVLLDPEAAGVARHWTLQEHLLLVGGQLIVALAVYAGPALVGAHVATRRRYTGLVRLRAAEAVERQRERAAGAVMAERARMARELHDIAAHHLSGMVVQAGAAERLIGRDDPAAREATAWIRSQGRETLDSLRLVVGALRDPGEGPAGDGPPDSGAPVPGAAALDRLVRTERELGADVELVREGDPYDLPPIADVTVYRVAREALSNARDHAPGAPVRILLRYGASRVALRVDNGPGRGRGGGPQSDAPRGMGLIGMAERAQLVGAELEAGPLPGGGWRVVLDLPVDRQASAAARPARENTDAAPDTAADTDEEGFR